MPVHAIAIVCPRGVGAARVIVEGSAVAAAAIKNKDLRIGDSPFRDRNVTLAGYGWKGALDDEAET